MSAATRRLEINPELCSGFSARCPHRVDEGIGAIAQLGERLHGMQEVGGSIPPGSTTFHRKAKHRKTSTSCESKRRFVRAVPFGSRTHCRAKVMSGCGRGDGSCKR